MACRNYFSRLTLFIILFYCRGIAWGNELPQVSFWSDVHGLSGNEVRQITQDPEGFLWIFSTKGVDRFDGYSLVSFQVDSTHKALLGKLNSVEEWQQKGFLLGGTFGLTLYLPYEKRFQEISLPGENPWIVNQLQKDKDGNLWIATNRGLWYWEPSGNKPRKVFDQKDNSILSLALLTNGEVMLGFEKGVGAFNPTTQAFEWVGSQKPHLRRFAFKSISEGQEGMIWMATARDGLVALDDYGRGAVHHWKPEKNNPNSLSSLNLNGVCVDAFGHVWVSTRWMGLCKLEDFETGKGRFIRVENVPGSFNSLPTNRINGIMADRGGVVWVATYDMGMARVSPLPNLFVNYRHTPGKKGCPPGNDVPALLLDKDGWLWTGTWSDGIGCFKFEDRNISVDINNRIPQKYRLTSRMLQAHDGTIWAGCSMGVIQISDPKGNPQASKVNFFLPEPEDQGTYASNMVSSLCEDRLHQLWVGTWSSLYRFDKKLKTFSPVNWLSPNTRVSSIKRDSLGFLWVGTQGKGLFRFNPQTGAHFQYLTSQNQGLKSDQLQEILLEGDSLIWVGIPGGLQKLNLFTGTFSHWRPKERGNWNEVTTILRDSLGHIWMGTEIGLYRFDREKETFHQFKLGHGIPENNVRGGLKVGNQFYIGTHGGYFTFDPLAAKVYDYLPPLAFTSITVAGRQVERPQSRFGEIPVLEVGYHERAFTIEIGALSYLNQDENRYAWLMEGLNDQWQVSHTGGRKVSFGDIAPGIYTFRMKAANYEGIWNDQSIALKVRVLPPFWLTGKAFALYGGLLVFLAIGGFYVAFRQRRQREYRVMEQAKIEADKRLNQQRLKFFTNISHEIRTPLTLIRGPLERMLESGDPDIGQLKLMKRSADRLVRMVDQIMDLDKLAKGRQKLRARLSDLGSFARETAAAFEVQANSRQIEFKVEVAENLPLVWFDTDKLDKVIFNLLSNAFKFVPDGGKVTLSVFSEKGTVKLRLSDNGPGIPKKEQERVFERFYQVDGRGPERGGTGIGLSMVWEFVKIHKATIDLSSESGKGTTFIITMLLGDSHLEDEEKIKEQAIVNSSNETSFEMEESVAIAQEDVPIVLLVEDDDDLRSYIAGELGKQYQIHQAGDGQTALEIARRETIDLVVTDVMMPGLSGTELCKRLKEDMNTSHLPIILLTARAREEQRIEGFEFGADAYITKPFNMKYLKVRIRKLLEIRQQWQSRLVSELELPNQGEGVGRQDKDFVETVLQSIKDHISNENLSVSFLADQVHVSTSLLQKKLKALTGTTPGELIRTVRLKKAAVLFEQGGKVSDVAYALGFSDPKYFSKCFKAEYGCSPSLYARKEKEDKE